MKDIIKRYILKTLELQETRLNCVNLGFSPSTDIKIELDMIRQAKELIDKKL